ncbi:MAG: urea ABC transporter permease subunit UrtB [Zoogloeaceae bacterium]|jgi:urea transport system permease protein|nr:urea ABC transporter permease subunit UrtB [Zoogloeaceae bacterium]
MVFRSLRASLLLCAAFLAQSAFGVTDLSQLADGDSAGKITALRQIAAQGDMSALPALEALQNGALYVVSPKDGKTRILIADATGAVMDAATGEHLPALPDAAESVTMNNRVRGALDVTLAALRLTSEDAETRLQAIRALKNNPEEKLLPLLEAALAKERDTEIAMRVRAVRALILLRSPEEKERLAAVRTLGKGSDPATLPLLRPLFVRDAQGRFLEPDARIRAAARQAVSAIEGRVQAGETLKRLFEGVSLGSILLLAALGLAITYGLMGVINMAHGELIMIGAYAAYATQTVTQRDLPMLSDIWLWLAIPVSFLSAAAVGVLMERLVIRRLYGRPLETLLATWGISLLLIQLVRTVFGQQNVAVENPLWLSGGLEIVGAQILPWNRVALIAFVALMLAAVAILLAKTRLGLFIRAATQNRPMSRCMGVPTRRVDSLAFGLGAGLAGLAGCALSQIGNVGPELGQGYIVDSFMVVVVGGVGQIAGAVFAALGLGILSKFIEGFAGAVLAKIAILLLIILFIQKRPQGIFALKGRFADA